MSELENLIKQKNDATKKRQEEQAEQARREVEQARGEDKQAKREARQEARKEAIDSIVNTVSKPFVAIKEAIVSNRQRKIDEKKFEEDSKKEFDEYLKFAESNKDTPIGTIKKENLEDGSIKSTLFTECGPLIRVHNYGMISVKGYFTNEDGMLEFRSVSIKKEDSSNYYHDYLNLYGGGFIVKNEKDDNIIEEVSCYQEHTDAEITKSYGDIDVILGGIEEFNRQEQALATTANNQIVDEK